MKAEKAMFVWTPDRDIHEGKPLAGSVAVTTIPESAELTQHPMSVGACDLDWREADAAGRIELMQKYITQFVERDNVERGSIRAALEQVDEFKNHPFIL